MSEQMSLFGGSDDEPPSDETPHARPGPAIDADLGRFPFDETLVEHLLVGGLSAGRVRLAYELVRLDETLSPAQHRALFMALVVGLEAQTQGSTFVPLSAPSSSHSSSSQGDYFARRLEALIPEELRDDEHWKPTTLMATLESLIDAGSSQIVGRDSDWKPLVVNDGRLYHQRMMLHEERLVSALAERLTSCDADRDKEALKAALDDVRQRQPPAGGGKKMELNAEQQYAVLSALHRPMTLITGGPGTGKTSIVVSILRTMVRLGMAPKAMALAAPTGKAANRMAESIYGQLDKLADPAPQDLELIEALDKPRTLHRLMGYSPRRDRFNHHAHNPLPHRMVIVDEASMIDLFIMERLLRAVSPKAHLVLLGDADQLPSVDTGAVLRDLIPDVVSTDAPWRSLVDGEFEVRSGAGVTASAAVRLQKSYRMREDDPAGRQILGFARSIRDYDQTGRLEPMAHIDDPTTFPDGVHHFDPDLDDLTQWWFSRVVLGADPEMWTSRFNHAHQLDDDGRLTDEATRRIKVLLRHYERSRILTLTRVYATGSEQLNEAFHRKTARLGRDRLENDFDFHPGEPVMMLRNDYDRDLFNGDQGIVVWCKKHTDEGARDLSLMAVFERTDKLIAYPLTELGEDLEHAFAMTVHKAQGSEFERVALVLPEQPMILLNRELLYTGLTRASRGVLLVGDPDLVEVGAANRSERFSAVGEKLQSAIQ